MIFSTSSGERRRETAIARLKRKDIVRAFDHASIEEFLDHLVALVDRHVADWLAPRLDQPLGAEDLDAFVVAVAGVAAVVDVTERAVGELDEEARDNPIAARMREERLALVSQGIAEDEAVRRAGYRVFGSKPGAYGAGRD